MLPYFQYSVKKIFDFVKKAFIVIVVYTLIIGFFVHFTSDEKKKTTTNTSIAVKTQEDLYKTLYDPKLSATISGNIFRATMCFFVGEVCTNNPEDAKENFKHSAFGFVTNLITLPIVNPPASGIYWAFSGLQNAGFIPKTYAEEGIGFVSIKPLTKVWTTFRNTTYILIVLVIITIGFMIMFRMKLDQQTVISVENSLPRLVIALLLITFSFPIAGFLIDLMYFTIIVSIYILSSTNIGDLNMANLAKMQDTYINAGFSRIWPYGGGVGTVVQIGESMINILPTNLSLLLRLGVGGLTAYAYTKLFSIPLTPIHAFENITAAGFGTGKLATIGLRLLEVGGFLLLVPWGLSLFLAISLLITLLFFLFRIVFLLLTSYIKILLLVIFSPFILLFEAVPGKNSFSFWIKSLLGELIAFPLVVIISLTGYIITQINTSSSPLPPFPFFSTVTDESAFLALLGMGLVLMTPDLIKMVREGLGLKGLPLAVGPGMFFGGAAMVGGGALGIVGSFGSISMAVPGIKNVITGKLPWLKKYIDPDRPNPPGTQSATGGGAGG